MLRGRLTHQFARMPRGIWRLGAWPLLLAGDVGAFVVARGLLGAGATSYTRLLPLTLGFLALAHAYRPRLTITILQDLPLLVPSLLAALTAYYLLVSPDRPLDALLFEALVLLAVLALVRAVTYAAIRMARVRGLVEHPTVLLGRDELTWELATILAARREFGLRPVGVLDDGKIPEFESSVPWLGDFHLLPKLLAERRATHVVVAFGAARNDDLVEALRICSALKCTIFVVPRLHELWDCPRACDEVWGIPLLRIRSASDGSAGRRLKRVVDVVVSALSLMVTAPVLMLVALAVRIELGRGVLSREARTGQHGRIFDLLQFRSLRPVHADGPPAGGDLAPDSRRGPVGRFIRATAIDEIPQLWNVLRGDMSLVGPRPERPQLASRFSTSVRRYPARHRVPVGLTGWAQVHGTSSVEQRIRFDNSYIERWSIWVDLTIVLRTVGHLAVAFLGLFLGLRGVRAPQAEAEFEVDADYAETVNRPPRVLHVSQPTEGGLARCVEQYIEASVRRGWDVALASPPGAFADRVRAAGVEVFDWPATRSPGPTVPREARALSRVVDSWCPDVVHLHSSKAGLAGRLALRGKVPTLFQPHAWSFYAVTGPVRAAALLWERVAHRWADLIVCVSEGERAAGDAAKIHANYAVAVNGVDLDQFAFADDAARDRARHELGLDADAPTVVCPARLCRQKGQDLLLNAWPAVLAAVPDAMLVLVGDGPEREALQARAPERTLFAGHHVSLRPWLAAADVVVLPSRWEGHALVLLEGMAVGRSLVASDVTGAAETVGADAGQLVSPGDDAALAAALVRRLAEPLLPRREGAAGRARVERAFDAATTVTRVLDLTAELVVRYGTVEKVMV